MRRDFAHVQTALLGVSEQFHGPSQRRARGRSNGCILLEEQRLRLDGPGHQFAIQAYPVGLELLPEMRGLQGLTQALQQSALQSKIVKETPSGARVADADASASDAKTPSRGLLVATEHNYRARAHVLLFADHMLDAFARVVREGFRRMLQQVRLTTGF